MAPSNDKDSVNPKKVESQLSEGNVDEETQTDGGLIKVTVDIEQETERLAPSILHGILNMRSDETLSDIEK